MPQGTTKAGAAPTEPAQCCTPRSALHSSRHLLVRRRLGPRGTLRADPEQELEGTALLTTVRGSDPEYIKRLKREMRVALRHAVTHPAKTTWRIGRLVPGGWAHGLVRCCTDLPA